MRATRPSSSIQKTASRLRIASIVLALLGAADAFYLWVLKITSAEAMCVGSRGCLTVNNSLYSEIAGVPVSVLGLVAYLMLAAILALEFRSGFFAQYGPFAVFGVSLAGVAFSAYLTYIEFYVIQAVCPFCVVSAVLITLLFGLSVARLIQQFLSND